MTDGTTDGTVLVYDLCGGPCASDPQGLTEAGGTLFLSADDGHRGRELWKVTPSFMPSDSFDPDALSQEHAEIKGLLLDGGRFTDDAERAALQAALKAEIDQNEAKIDDETRFTSDAELLVHQAVVAAEINQNEAKLDDGSRFTSDAERTNLQSELTAEIDENEAKIDTINNNDVMAELADIESQVRIFEGFQLSARLVACECTPPIYLPENFGGRQSEIQGLVESWRQAVDDSNDPDVDLVTADCYRTLAEQAVAAGRHHVACRAFASAVQTLSGRSGKGAEAFCLSKCLMP